MKVLIVVDMQNDFINGTLGTPEAQAIVPNVVNYIKCCDIENTTIIFTKDTHEENYINTLEGKNLPVPHCIHGTNGWRINFDVMNAFMLLNDSLDDNYMIEKPTFGSLDLIKILTNLNAKEKIEEITLMGLCTGICVMSNAILCKATLPEVPVNVVADCCACVTPRSHQVALEAMEMCQINII
jgi:nicotinamidase-related amidase